MSGNNTEKSNQSGSAKRGFIIIAVFLVIVIALVAVIAFLLGRSANSGSGNGTESSNSDNGRKVMESARVVLDEDSAANVMEEMRQEVEDGMFECKMSMTWTFPEGSVASKDAYVANSTNNKYPIYFDVILDGENIYSSPVLPVGAELKNIILDKDLEPGTYNPTVFYYLIRDEVSQEVISSAGFVVTVNVQG
jgi:hypothetical protein